MTTGEPLEKFQTWAAEGAGRTISGYYFGRRDSAGRKQGPVLGGGGGIGMGGV